MTQLHRSVEQRSSNEDTPIQPPDQGDIDYENPPTTTLTTPSSSAPNLYPQFLLFGDSITQDGTVSFQPSLQQLYVRRLDILNRGFSGYTTLMGLETIPHFLPITTPSPEEVSYIPRIKICTIFFGANDACMPGLPQHVPLDQYITALKRLINYPVFKWHQTKIILITPAPVDEHQFPQPLQRTAKNAARYATAVRQVASEMQIPCVDMWTAVMELCKYDPSQPVLPGSLDLPPNPALARLLTDGLHFSVHGYNLLTKTLMDVIRDQAPECLPENIPVIFRGWREIMGVPPKED